MVAAAAARSQPGEHESPFMISMNAARGWGRYDGAVPDVLQSLSPPPFRQFMLAASHGHQLHVQQWGTAGAPPLLLLHGGPGSGLGPALYRGLDPARWHVIGLDQRGAGRSLPAGSIEHNTTAHLLTDLALLRRTLGIDRWWVLGGSWGATLALAYALAEPAAVAGLLLRSAFLARPADMQPFMPLVDTFLAAAGDADERSAIARAWWQLETRRATGTMAPPPEGDALAVLLQRYTVQAHYLHAGCWLQHPPLLDRLAPLRRLPVQLVHGTADRICPPDSARLLAERLPQARLHWAEGAGHDPMHPAMVAAMAAALADATTIEDADRPAAARPPEGGGPPSRRDPA